MSIYKHEYLKCKNKYLKLKSSKYPLLSEPDNSDNSDNLEEFINPPKLDSMNKDRGKSKGKSKSDINKILNPELKIIPIAVKNKKFHIVRDDFLVGGTKQRMLGKIIMDSNCTEFVYAGPIYGFAQIALAYVAKMLNKKATLFLETKKPRWSLTKFASKYNPKIIEVGRKATLKRVQGEAVKYVDRVKKKRGKNYICLIPFGLHSDEYVKILARQIEDALPKKLRENHPKRFWLVAGSATILNALYIVFPKTFFNVVQVGRTIWPDLMDETRTKLYVSDQRFWERAMRQPPYPTVSTYDAKLWIFALRYGEDGDYIWNVGRDK